MNFPECPHLIHGQENKICSILAEQTGGLLGPVSPIRCNVTCKASGPYCGKSFSREQTSQFVANQLLMSRLFWKNGTFMKKVLNKYLTAVDINFPKVEWEKIKTKLSPFIENGTIENIYLTGSLILKIDGHKDYDILLKIKSWDDFLKIEKLLPIEIDGVKCDYFFTTHEKMVDRFFTVLDCENKILYESSWYKLNINSIPNDIRRESTAPLDINKHIESKMKEIIKDSFKLQSTESPIIDDKLKEILTSKIGWTYAKNSWLKATSLLNSTVSRGVLPTFKQLIGIDNSDGNMVDEETYNQRKVSCFGDNNIPPCSALKKNIKGNWMCGACGCGDNNIAILEEIEGSYSKLMYPYLECPLKKKGFSNYTP